MALQPPQPTWTNLSQYTGEFTLVDAEGISFTAIWQRYPTRPTKNKGGVSGWAVHNDKLIRVHACSHTPCISVHETSKYGDVPVPKHGLFIPPAVAGLVAKTADIASPALNPDSVAAVAAHALNPVSVAAVAAHLPVASPPVVEPGAPPPAALPPAVVPFEPLRDETIELYGAAVDHPDFHNAFRAVLPAAPLGPPEASDVQTDTFAIAPPPLYPPQLPPQGAPISPPPRAALPR